MKQPKFKVGQVVGVRRSTDLFFKVARHEHLLWGGDNKMPTAFIQYYLRGWELPVSEAKLRKLTKKEIANG